MSSTRPRSARAGRWLSSVIVGVIAFGAARLVSWWSSSTPLWYALHIEGQRPDLTVVDDRTRLDQGMGDVTDVIEANLSTRPVYVIRIDPVEMATLERRYVLEPVVDGDPSGLARVVSRREARR